MKEKSILLVEDEVKLARFIEIVDVGDGISDSLSERLRQRDCGGTTRFRQQGGGG